MDSLTQLYLHQDVRPAKKYIMKYIMKYITVRSVWLVKNYVFQHRLQFATKYTCVI